MKREPNIRKKRARVSSLQSGTSRGDTRACLAVDVGNTSVSLAVVRGERAGRVVRLPGGEQKSAAVARAIRSALAGADVAGAALCSVVPAAVPQWSRELEKATGRAPLPIRHTLDLGVTVDYPKPATIGADRLANASAALARYGAPAIVADFGTAVTFDIVSARGAYTGGVIAPGLPLMTDYLCERTALLPRIALRAGGARGAIGRSTEAAMRIGARLGYGGMVAAIVAGIRRDLRAPKATLCATGGFARWVLSQVELPFVFDPDLTLYGIARIFRLNA